MAKKFGSNSHGLRGGDDYYCDIVEYGGVRFFIREMEDEVLERYFKLTQEITTLRNAALENVANENAETTLKLLKLFRERLDVVVESCVTKWDGITEECTPENLLRLSPNTKTAIFRVAEKHSLLSYEEEDFSMPSSAQ